MKKIYDTGRVPLIIRLIVLPFASGAIFVTGNFIFEYFHSTHKDTISASSVIGLLASLFLSFFLLSIWFLRNEFFYSQYNHSIIIAHHGLLIKYKKKITLSGAEAIYTRCTHIRVSEFWDIGILYSNDKKQYLTRLHDKISVDKIAASFSEASGLPITDI